MKGLYRFSWDCGRSGDIEGMFIADDTEIANLIGREVNFGEALGKHSQVNGPVEANEIKLMTDDKGFIAKYIEILGDGTISGYNPLDYLDESDDQEYEDYDEYE